MKIAVLDDYLKVAQGLADWASLKADVKFFHDYIEPASLVKSLAGFDVIVAMRERSRLSAELLGQLPELKLIVTTGLRNASIDMQACKERGIMVCGAPGSDDGGKGTAELGWALLMALANRIPQEAQNMREGHWQTAMTPVLSSKRLGVVGLGKLGQLMARYGKAFDMDVVAWSPNLTEERASAAGVRRVEKDELFSGSDFITINLVLSASTQGIVDAHSIGLMKPTACLVNTSRAGLIDQNALRSALESSKIAGVGLDVFDVEPLPADDPWRRVPNALLTPHLGYANPENFAAYYPNVVQAIAAWKKGEPVRVID
ncbi:D-2-hydroxyacid dehydrogenase family protein [Orrella marina]|uniref:Hydroxyacid dehydrogenase n=1 Tax=Orrella marina TaxID=2163011 RepID=A0A2R4XL37_9BURK|nr:D-2-hydroxyacid dehydrogenase family protein [Orrella marina]AWB34528.1 hydroxyacid dehydrogenase [Orrella marina]